MLAPPPEGTFDIDNESLPLKSVSKTDGSLEQAPLLAQKEEVITPKEEVLTQKEEVTSTDPNASNQWKVRLTWWTDIFLFFCHVI